MAFVFQHNAEPINGHERKTATLYHGAWLLSACVCPVLRRVISAVMRFLL